MINYFWVRIYDYKKDDELKEHTDDFTWGSFKGTLLDEYYLCGEEMKREDAKKEVVQKSGVSKFAKPRKNEGIYAILLDSSQFYYDRFNMEIDTLCFNFHKPIKGKLKDFTYIDHDGEKYCFCNYDCKHDVNSKLYSPEGEFQEREDYRTNGGVYGYIYHIYNRNTNMHYVGQTIYMPFFRWQEHVKSGLKGDICDLVFETITEVRVKSQEYLNSVEAWWIRKYIEEYGRDNVINITVPKITMEELVVAYAQVVAGQTVLAISKQEVANGKISNADE